MFSLLCGALGVSRLVELVRTAPPLSDDHDALILNRGALTRLRSDCASTQFGVHKPAGQGKTKVLYTFAALLDVV
jgi:hypothetical protein